MRPEPGSGAENVFAHTRVTLRPIASPLPLALLAGEEGFRQQL